MLLDSIAEALRIGEEGGVGVQISHVKASGPQNWPKIDAALRMIEDARARGVDVYGDVYPYNAGSTKLDNMMPAWAHEGGVAKLLERLADKATRGRIVEECLIDGDRWGTVSQGGIGFDQVFIATCRRRELEGLDLAQIARQAGRPPAEVLMDLLLEEKCTIGMVSFAQSLENVAKVLAHPALMIGSDSIPLYEGEGDRPGKPHPRTYGTFPRVLGEYARDRKLFPLETAIHKMTGMPARRLGLADRGVVREGAFADLAVIDPGTVRDESSYADPHRYPSGIPYVVVNGVFAVDGGRWARAAGAGRVLTPA
jgi:N-acyl-D-amino-acid deacylase